MSDKQTLKLKFPLTIISLIAILAVIGYFIFSPNPPKNCFKFNDGSMQGWTLDQLYDANASTFAKVQSIIPGNPPTYQTYTPFSLNNSQNIALEASAAMFLVPDKNVSKTDIYFDSPDLTNNQDWQQILGYKFDLHRLFTGKCGDPPNSFYAQIQLVIIDKSNKERTISEKDNSGKFKFYDIAFDKPYALEWKWGNPLTLGTETLYFADYKVKKLRIRCTMPGYISNGECWYQGSWKIGNICPL